MSTANSLECLKACVGKTVTGVIQAGHLPGHSAASVLVLSDGTGLAINHKGSFWEVDKHHIADARRKAATELATLIDEYQSLIALIGPDNNTP